MPRTMALGFDSIAWTDFVGAWFVCMFTFIDLEDLGLPTGQGTLITLKTREGFLPCGKCKVLPRPSRSIKVNIQTNQAPT